MRELWLKTFELFRRHPVLWAPYACAELLGFSLSTLRRMAYKPILYWFARTTKASVLGGTTTTYDWAKGRYDAILFAWPLEWGTRYFTACLLTSALLLTTLCVSRLAQLRTPDWSSAVKLLCANAKAVLIYALKFFAVMLAATAVFVLPATYLTVHLGQTEYSPLAIAAGLLDGAVVAWIMTPIALKLLRPPDAPPAAAQAKKFGRYFAILATFASAILEFAIPRLETHFQLRGRLTATALFAFNDLLMNLPLLFLFIALALLALEVPPTGAAEPALHLPDAIRNLMPLHYPPADEEQ